MLKYPLPHEDTKMLKVFKEDRVGIFPMSEAG